jgi:hypothetical protein
MLQHKAHWYVYELIDPRNGEVFYVGKGKGNRIDDHEWEAKTGHPSYKCNKIRSIWDDGHQIIKQKVAEFWDEDAAYEHEEDRIVSIGLDNLTNITGGGRRKLTPYTVPKKEKVKGKRWVPKTALPDVTCWKIVRGWTGWVAAWLKRPNPTDVLTLANASPLTKIATEGLVNKLIPVAIKKLSENPNNHPELIELLRPWNIDLRFEKIES